MSNQTFGQKAVGLSFNPSGDDAVAQAKQSCADLIDKMHAVIMVGGSPEACRMAEIAIAEIQTAQMWVVKVLTWKD
jgi:hypothetical protein